MAGGYYKVNGRSRWRVWIPWKGKKISINKALDGTKLDDAAKAQAVLREIHFQMEHAMFDPLLWRNKDNYKTEWETRQLAPHYDKVGICSICGERTRVCQDHDHLSGLLRGKLCRNCNLALGIFKENKESLLGALRYLLFWERQGTNRETYAEWKKHKEFGTVCATPINSGVWIKKMPKRPENSVIKSVV